MRDSAVVEQRKSGGFAETFRTIIYAVVIAFGVRTFAFEPFNIPSGSMIPTLLVGDYLFVSKLSYGYSKFSVAFGMNLFDGRLLFTPPKRGDVAVFKLPRDNSTDYIKRIVGLPGDKIQVTNGVLHINGQPVIRRRIEDYVLPDRFGARDRYEQYLETLPNGVSYRVVESSPNAPLDNTGVFTVPADHYFAMGDNRDNSLDSRVPSAVGFIPVENLVGRAEILFFSIDEAAHFWELWKWPWAVRFGRILRTIS